MDRRATRDAPAGGAAVATGGALVATLAGDPAVVVAVDRGGYGEWTTDSATGDTQLGAVAAGPDGRIFTAAAGELEAYDDHGTALDVTALPYIADTASGHRSPHHRGHSRLSAARGPLRSSVSSISDNRREAALLRAADSPTLLARPDEDGFLAHLGYQLVRLVRADGAIPRIHEIERRAQRMAARPVLHHI